MYFHCKYTAMGSQLTQAKLWGQRPEDWANIQEATGQAGYDFAMDNISFEDGVNVLDVGCGTGYFCKLVADNGAGITGIDATPEFIERARLRVPAGNFLVGDMEELPFADNSFDVVAGFNSFQYAANTANALAEAKRVLVAEGKLVVMIWGNKEDCEAATYLKAVGSLLPPPPPGAAGPFALSENQLLEKLLTEAGFTIITLVDIPAVWDYPDTETALKGLMSVGPVSRAIEVNGFDKVYATIKEAVKPYTTANGHVVYHNKNRMAICSK